jgi:recombination associated protein RdgC
MPADLTTSRGNYHAVVQKFNGLPSQPRHFLRAEEMEKQLAELTFTPCGSQDMAKTGWVPPMGSHSDALTHTANGQIVICARKEEKILPSPVIKQALEAKIFKLEADQGRKLKKPKKIR